MLHYIVVHRSSLHWYALLFAVGAASTAVEVTGLRFLAPLFGSSLPVWGAVIATVLAGLAWGYTRGGRRAQQPLTADIVVKISALAAALFLCLPAAFHLAAFLRNASLRHDSPLLLLGACAAAFIALLLPSVVFGMISPLAVQVESMRRQQSAGHVAGRISTLTTLGSLVGILLPSFVTIPLLGTRCTVWIFAGVVLLLCSTSLRKNKNAGGIASLAAISFLTSLLPSAQSPGTIFAAETRHQHVIVHQDHGQRRLSFDASFGTQSVAATRLYTNGYWDYLAALPSYFSEQDELSVLVLGAAASTTERQLQRFWQDGTQFRFTSVELDSALFDVADTYFDPPARTQVAADARAFVASANEKYDIIILDVYARELSVPFHLATTEFFEQVASRLAPGGLFAINANAVSSDTLWIRSLATTLRTAFSDVRIAAVPDSCNYVLLAAAQAENTWKTAAVVPATVTPLLAPLQAATIPAASGIVLTDDRSPTDILGFLALVSRTPGSCA